MVSMSDELKERNILKLILMVRFACAALDVGHPINPATVFRQPERDEQFLRSLDPLVRHRRGDVIGNPL
jgi:hypothetical protein